MLIRSSIVGLVITMALVMVLGSVRLFDTSLGEPKITLHAVEVFEMEPPPPPPDFAEEDPEPQQEDDRLPDTPPPPSPNLDLSTAALSLDQPEIPLGLKNVSLDTAFQSFHSDRPPALIPSPPKPKPPVKRPLGKPKGLGKSNIPSRPKPKAYYGASDLDRLPRERSRGRFVWPSSVRGRTGTAKLFVEIDESGRMHVIKVISASHAALGRAAVKVAKGSRYTVPTFRGKPVKTRFYKSYKLQKPR